LIDYYKNDLYFVSQGSSKIFEEEVIVSVISDVIKKAKFVLDIGAHAGSHSVVYKSLNNSLKIIAFEPQKEMFQLLQHNIMLNQLEDVEVFNLALGHKPGLATLGNRIHDIDRVFDVTYDPDVLTNLGGVGFGTGGESVQVTTIDDLNLDRCDFIKIDAEGAENLIILGGKRTIIKFKPTIFFEANFKSLTKETLGNLGVVSDLKSTQELLSDFGYTEIRKIDWMNYLAVGANF
jgi:FkbM family methyltransferase